MHRPNGRRSRLERSIVAGVAILAFGHGALPQAASPASPTTAGQAPAATTTGGGSIHGTVKAGNVPLPGVAITATNTLTGKKYATSTDIDGKYAMTIPRTGRYVVRAELAAFAPVTNEVRITAEATDQAAEFSLQLASRAAQAQVAAGARTSRTAQAQGAGTLGLSLAGDDSLADASAGGGNIGASLPSLGGLGADTAGASSDAVTVSGAQGTTNALGGLSEDQIRSRVEDAMAQSRQNGGGNGDQMNAVVSMLGGIMNGGGGFGPGGGGPGGGRGGRGGGGGGGNFRNFNPAQPHGSIFYQAGNSALNSAPWSPTLQPLTNPSAYSNRFGVSIAGTPYLPGLTKPDTRQFVFINLTGQRNLNAFLPNPERVPTALERAGDFSQSYQKVTGNGTLTPVALYDPVTGAPIPGNNLANSTSGISPQALALLNYYPACNVNCTSTDPTVYNYQTVSNAGSNNTAINTRYQRQLGQQTGGGPFGGGGGGGGGRRGGGNANQPPVLRQNINASYNYSHSASDLRNIFLPLGGATVSDGNAVNLGYVVSYGRLSNNASINWNRSDSETRNFFTDTNNNPSALAGLAIPNQAGSMADPKFYNGLPSLSITNFAGLTNTTPTKTINQTISFSDFVAWRRRRHNMRYGVDIRRVHADSIGGNNPLGQFTFTGYATESPGDQVGQSSTATSGSGFADFLLGLPESTKIQAGLNKIYLRENVFDLYATDDFRILSNVTLNYGLRYEYFAPYTEKNNRLVNLDHNANFSAVAVVMPGANGPFQGAFNSGLVNPDRTMFAPRFGGAWSPKSKWTKNTVVRGGYGINYNTGGFAAFAKSLSFQPPFAQTQTNNITVATLANPTPVASGCTTTTPTKTFGAVTIPGTAANVTLANGFGTSAASTGCSTLQPIHNSYSVNKNYRLGMVQIYNLNIQRTVQNIVLNIGYNGAKGSNLDVVGSPNSTPNGDTLAGVSSFIYENSVAGSHSNQLVVSAQRRQVKGVALGVTYAYSHAIDNTTTIGGASGSATPVQNFYRLDLEEANSSFDQRHLLTGNWLYELPFGPNREYLNKGGIAAKLLDGFSLSGNFNFGSGNYFTPQYSGNTAEATSGNDYTQRPNRVFTTPIHGAGQLRQFFNTAAFTLPTVIGGITQFGTASRNSIEGPGTVSTNATLSRTVPMGGTRNFEARVTATNVFNTVQYSGINTVVNSANYGQVTNAAAMRSVQVQARYRF